jgi:hypothetical protein
LQEQEVAMNISNKRIIGLVMLMTLAGCESPASIEQAESHANASVVKKCRAHASSLYLQSRARDEYIACLQANGVKT